MNVKGIIYGVAKNAMVAAFGEEHWNSFMIKLAANDKFFSNVIMSITPVPLEKVIFFLTRCVRNSSTTTECST